MLFCRVFLGILVLASISGCSQAPARIEAPSWDPDGFADAVLSKLDKSGDGSLDKSELSAAVATMNQAASTGCCRIGWDGITALSANNELKKSPSSR